MKGRAHNWLSISEPPDDWGDGSWTMECSCGVTFDDGEEMVNCDERGVWVHTRCSRFVRGEKSFACDKCKPKKGENNNDNSEETEVAQLLPIRLSMSARLRCQTHLVADSGFGPISLWRSGSVSRVCLVVNHHCFRTCRQFSHPTWGSARALCLRSSLFWTGSFHAGRRRRGASLTSQDLMRRMRTQLIEGKMFRLHCLRISSHLHHRRK